ncbi:odorant receptor 107-1 [Anguilla anguilla]|uniref:odorant receptor 107-1 n=1 Tax=Anguilla anguilla TaxID=7936 RepID=UPI0015AE739F|nr:odorant receptor 107-1 [Anguilla anguilla]XP_035241109.1 odorant receptor 107-1 [Anguilla anguilla]
MNPLTNFIGNSSADNGFYISAFDSLAHKNYLILILSVIYIITMAGNLILLSIVLMNTSLHNAKYIAVCNLALVDISVSSIIIPQMVPVFVFDLNHVSFGMCFSQMFFMHFFTDMESFSLAVLAYDRLVAICFPLRYATINTNPRMFFILAGMWALVFLVEIYPVSLAVRLPYCASRVVRSCCCEHGPVYILACADVSYNRSVAKAKTLAVLFGPLAFILCTYVVAVAAVLKIASPEQRRKAFSTCLTHMLLVLVYYLPVILAYLAGSTRLVTSLDMLTAILTVCVTLPPMLNPIIYSLKTEELREKIAKMLGLQREPKSNNKGPM